MSKAIEVVDLTNSIIAGSFVPEMFEEDCYQAPPSGQVTVSMLKRHPKIRNMLAEEFSEFFIRKKKKDDVQVSSEEDKEDEEDEEEDWTEDPTESAEDISEEKMYADLTDEQIANIVNSDPNTQASLIEVLLNTNDIDDEEGEPLYRPSIFDSNDVDELIQMEIDFGGFREFKEEIPGKYDHLDEKTLDMIYAYPECRKYLAKMEQKITPKMVLDLCGRIDSIRT